MLMKLASIIIHNPRGLGIDIPVNVVASRRSKIVTPIRSYVNEPVSDPDHSTERVELSKPSEGLKPLEITKPIEMVQPFEISQLPETSPPPNFKGQIFPGEWLVDALRQVNFSMSLEERDGNEKPLFQLRIKQERSGLTRMGQEFFDPKNIYEVMERIADNELMIQAHHQNREIDSRGWRKSCIFILRPLYRREIAGDYLEVKFPLYGEKLFVEFPELPVTV